MSSVLLGSWFLITQTSKRSAVCANFDAGSASTACPRMYPAALATFASDSGCTSYASGAQRSHNTLWASQATEHILAFEASCA